MKEDFENIDGLFKEELKNYAPDLPEGAWDNIASKLQGKGRKSRLIPVSWRAAAAIALLIGTATLGTYLFINKPDYVNISEADNTSVTKEKVESTELTDADEIFESKSQDIIEPEKSTNNEAKKTVAFISEVEDNTETFQEVNNSYASVQQNEAPVIKNPIRSNISYEIPVQHDELIAQNNLILAYNNYNKVQDENLNNSQNNQNFIWENIEESSGNTERKDQWLIGGQAGPQYTYRTLSSEVTAPERIDETNKNENGLISYAAGLNVEYKPARRFSIQSGIYYSKLSYEGPATVSFQTNNIDQLAFGRPSEISTVTSDEIVVQFPNSSVEIVNKSNSSLEETNTAYLAQSSDYSKEFDASELSNEAIAYKNYEYIEIPVIARYAVIDKKINFHVMGGLSTNILINEYVEVDYQIDLPGEYGSTNLNTLNYSSTIGLGFGYDISQNVVMTVEPQFKYFLGSQTYFRNDVHPYSFGIYTGLKYLF
jgi:hypothetical protein